jgi:hypothetical protein
MVMGCSAIDSGSRLCYSLFCGDLARVDGRNDAGIICYYGEVPVSKLFNSLLAILIGISIKIPDD